MKKDRSRLSVRGAWFYAGAGVVLFIHIAFLIVHPIPIEPWGIETDKFMVYADTLNEKISAIVVLLLFLSVMGYMAFTAIRFTKEKPKWINVLIWSVAIFMLLTVALSSLYLLRALVASFL